MTRDKVERINKAIDEQSRLLDELVLKKRRPALERPGRDEAGLAEHKAAFEAYVRRGDDQALRDLDQKALSQGSPAMAVISCHRRWTRRSGAGSG